MKTTLAHKKIDRKKKKIELATSGNSDNPKKQKTEKLRPLNLYSFKTISNHQHRK